MPLMGCRRKLPQPISERNIAATSFLLNLVSMSLNFVPGPHVAVDVASVSRSVLSRVSMASLISVFWSMRSRSTIPKFAHHMVILVAERALPFVSCVPGVLLFRSDPLERACSALAIARSLRVLCTHAYSRREAVCFLSASFTQCWM